MSLLKSIYYGLPARVFVYLKTVRKPLLLVLVSFGLAVVYGFVLAFYAVVNHNPAPLKGSLVGFALVQKLEYRLNNQPVPENIENLIRNATPAEQSFGGWFFIFSVLETALLGAAVIWSYFLERKAAKERQNKNNRGGSDGDHG